MTATLAALGAASPGIWARIGASVLQVAAVATGGPLLLGLMGKVRARA